MSRVKRLIQSYSKYISVPWRDDAAAAQRVIFCVYNETEERWLRAKVDEFEIVTRQAGHEWAMFVIVLSLIAVVSVGLVALVQDDMKKLIAYSSVSHMGFVTLGIFIAFSLVRDYGNLDGARLGLQGAMVQMISHGFISVSSPHLTRPTPCRAVL